MASPAGSRPLGLGAPAQAAEIPMADIVSGLARPLVLGLIALVGLLSAGVGGVVFVQRHLANAPPSLEGSGRASQPEIVAPALHATTSRKKNEPVEAVRVEKVTEPRAR